MKMYFHKFWQHERRIPMKYIIAGIFYAIITMFGVVTTMNCDKPKDIPIELLK
jgi:hypothetical protein